MSRAYSEIRGLPSSRWHTFVWLALIAALLALRFTPPNLTCEPDHQVLLKQGGAHDKRPCVQRLDTVFDSSIGLTRFTPILTAFDFSQPHTRSKARESNTSLYNRPPPLG